MERLREKESEMRHREREEGRERREEGETGRDWKENEGKAGREKARPQQHSHHLLLRATLSEDDSVSQ